MRKINVLKSQISLVVFSLGVILSLHPIDIFCQSKEVTKSVKREDDYYLKFKSVGNANSCYCSSQNDFGINFYVDTMLYPYRGNFAQESKRNTINERINKKIFDSLSNNIDFAEVEIAYYAEYINPESPPSRGGLLDIAVTKLFDYEFDLSFTDGLVDTVNGQVSKVLIPNQMSTITQFGKVNDYPHLKHHWYHFSTYDTKLMHKDLGIYSQINHFFSFSKRTFSVTFNFDHTPTLEDFQNVHQFLLKIGQKCQYKSYTYSQLGELRILIEQYYILALNVIYESLSNIEKNQAIDCAVEKLAQKYNYDDLMHGVIDTNLFDQITIGCIEYLHHK
jgi:hypothetical protein